MGLMTLRHRMVDAMPYYLRLPSTYEKLPYVTANGNQAIRTSYVPVQNDEFHARFKGASGTLLSAGAGTYQLVIIGGFSGEGWYYRYFASSTVSANAEYTASTWYDLDIDTTGKMTTNGKTFTSAYQSALDGNATDMWICERRNATQQYSGSIAEFWIKNNGKFKMYLIPCKRKSDNKVGMYDTINKTFYTSSRNDFVAGT